MGTAAIGHRSGRLGGHCFGGLARRCVDRFIEAALMPHDGLFCRRSRNSPPVAV
jgi:hypothetical protein